MLSDLHFGSLPIRELGDLFANGVVIVKLNARAIRAIERHGKNTGCGRFPCSSRPDEKISMRQAVLGDGVPEGTDNMLLAEDISKSFGTIFTGEDLITHAAMLARPESEARGFFDSNTVHRQSWLNG